MTPEEKSAIRKRYTLMRQTLGWDMIYPKRCDCGAMPEVHHLRSRKNGSEYHVECPGCGERTAGNRFSEKAIEQWNHGHRKVTTPHIE